MLCQRHLLMCMAPLFVLGCVATQSEIESQRRAFVAKPDLPRYGYDGKPLDSGKAYLFLKDHDTQFGEYLLSLTATTEDADVIVAALTYFHSTKPNQQKYDEVVAHVRGHLLSKRVIWGNTDVIRLMRLSEWIVEDKIEANSPTPTPASVPPTAGAPGGPPPRAAGL